MSQQEKRNNSTVACTNCRKRHGKCNKLSGEKKCTNCNKRNLDCTFKKGNKRGPKPAANAYQNVSITDLSPVIYDERMSNNDQNITSSLNSSPNSFSASDSLSHPYSHTTTVANINTYETTETIETTEIFQNTQPSLYSLYSHNDQIMPINDQNISSFSTDDLNGSFYQETP
ncbi:28054_t:CDS:1, partial [Racocetra persica]